MVDAAAIAKSLGLPPEATVLFIAMLPVFELRGAIPVAMGVYSMPASKAYLLGVLGNIVPVVPLLLLLRPVSEFLSKHSRLFEGFFDWLFERTRRKMESRYEKYGALALVPFVAIPLPVTGAWTGCAAAFVFGIRFRYSFPAIVGGITVSGFVVTAASAGVAFTFF
ncbi:MAG: small multi-drug export protein [Halobacteria archaeon]|nr:small multi-drug export protein [Halobacteria archaeon]